MDRVPHFLNTYVVRVVEAQILLECVDILHLLLGNIPRRRVEVLCQSLRIVALRDDTDIALSGPSQEYLSWCLVLRTPNLLDRVMF